MSDDKLLIQGEDNNRLKKKQIDEIKEIQKLMDELKKYGLKSYFLIFPDFTLDYQKDEAALHEFNNRVLLFINGTNKHLFDIGLSMIQQRGMGVNKKTKEDGNYFG